MFSLRVSPDDHDRRLDRVLRKAFPDLPPGAIAGAIRRGNVRVNGERSRNSARLHAGDTVTVPSWETDSPVKGGRHDTSKRHAPASRDVRVGNGAIHHGNRTIPILARTDDWIAVGKPAGIATHGEGSVEELVREAARREGWWRESLSFRPGPVHRLDRGTSGVLLIALSTRGAQTLTEEIHQRRMIKLYLALLTGEVSGSRDITWPLRYDHVRRKSVVDASCASGSEGDPVSPDGYQAAHTRIVPLAKAVDQSATLVAAIPLTGRRHQIRAHCAAAGHPLTRDEKYSRGKYSPGKRHRNGIERRGDRATSPPGSHLPRGLYLLHAMLAAMPHRGYRWEAPLPEEIRRRLEQRIGGIEVIEHRVQELFAGLEREFPQPPVLPTPGAIQ